MSCRWTGGRLGAAFLDTSALTGESLPVRLARGRGDERLDQCGRGLRPDGDARGEGQHLCRDRPAGRGGAASKAPMSRLADRWSLGFLAVTVAIAFAAWWFTGDPIRAVAVLVVATPCPLILAVPVALVAGCRGPRISACWSRAPNRSRRWRGSGPDPRQDRHADRRAPADRRSTATTGWPSDDILRLAAALDQASKHPVAQAIVAAARERG
jgi:hypothetical protein